MIEFKWKPGTCFMGRCKKLFLPENDAHFCVDVEAQQGLWGECFEFEEDD